jgi:ribosome maturation factor RimP
MQGQTSRIHELLEPVITGMGYELVGIENVSEGGDALLRIYIDHEPGVTVDDCERVSRQVGAVLDVEGTIRGGYTLEVSSPGWDRPLFTPAHFQRFAGSDVRLQLTELTENRRKFKGRLIGMQEGDVLIEVDGTEYRIPFNRIAKARLVAD